MKNPFRIGKKIYLRPLDRADAPVAVAWMNDPEVTCTLRWHRPINLQAEEEFIDNAYRSEHDLLVGIVAIPNDVLVGAAMLRAIDGKNRHAEFAITIGEKGEWDHGYGTEATFLLVQYAFETLNLNRVWLHVYEDNERAIHAYEKVGFRREGVLRQETFRQGRYWDTIIMAILREEWSRVEIPASGDKKR